MTNTAEQRTSAAEFESQPLPPLILTVCELRRLLEEITIEFYGSYGGGGYWYQARGGKLRQWDPSCSLDRTINQLTGARWSVWSERDHALAEGVYADAPGRLIIDPQEADKDPGTRGWIK